MRTIPPARPRSRTLTTQKAESLPVPLRVEWADLEDSESEYDDEWERMHTRDWDKVTTTSHLPTAAAASPPAQSGSAAKRRGQRQRRQAGAQPAPKW